MYSLCLLHAQLVHVYFLFFFCYSYSFDLHRLLETATVFFSMGNRKRKSCVATVAVATTLLPHDRRIITITKQNKKLSMKMGRINTTRTQEKIKRKEKKKNVVNFITRKWKGEILKHKKNCRTGNQEANDSHLKCIFCCCFFRWKSGYIVNSGWCQ